MVTLPAIPTLTFSNIEDFCKDVAARSLGGSPTDAIRVQGQVRPAGGCFCRVIEATAFDPVSNCVLALRLDFGTWSPYQGEGGLDMLRRAVAALTCEFKERGFSHILPGTWVHAPAFGNLATLDEGGRVVLRGAAN